MKIDPIKRIVFGLLAYSFFLAEPGQAQPSVQPVETTSLLNATMYPVTGDEPVIKINFDNTTGGAVRLMIQNQYGRIFYDEREYAMYYRRRFNLAELPAGHYTVELSKGDKHYKQTFAIEPPTEKHVALENSDSQTSDKKWAANQ